MLRKLLKYEYKATARTFLPLYGGLLLITLLCSFSFRQDSGVLAGITSLVFFALFVAVWVITLIFCIQRFNNNLLKREGYLMFTLPVKTSSLIWSKAISSGTWIIASALVSLLSMLLFALTIIEGPLPWADMQQAFQEFFLMVDINGVSFMIQIILSTFIGTLSFLLVIYASLSIGQMPFAGRHRFLASFGAFIVINILIQQISNFVTHIYSQFSGNAFEGLYSNVAPNTPQFLSLFFQEMNGIMWLSNLVSIAVCVGLFFLTHYLLKHQLNLE